MTIRISRQHLDAVVDRLNREAPKPARNWKQAPLVALNGTCLQGYLDCSYADLVAVFGKEHSKGDDYKIQAEWELQFDDGTIATVYDYKMGKKYNGADGIPKTKVRDWHIGGHNKRAVELVTAAMRPTTKPGEKA